MMTDDQKAVARRLYVAGESVSNIAQIVGVSRNAVIGFAYRAGLVWGKREPRVVTAVRKTKRRIKQRAHERRYEAKIHGGAHG